jgi:hypothetical protein
MRMSPVEYVPWNIPESPIAASGSIAFAYESSRKFSVVVSFGEGDLRILFNHVVAVRFADECSGLGTLEASVPRASDGHAPYPLLRAIHSPWLASELARYPWPGDLFHYVFLSSDQEIEFLAGEPSNVEWLRDASNNSFKPKPLRGSA